MLLLEKLIRQLSVQLMLKDYNQVEWIKWKRMHAGQKKSITYKRENLMEQNDKTIQKLLFLII